MMRTQHMCTGAAWFNNALFVAFREGDGHVSPNGKVLVKRSRDEGVLFEHVALLRGAGGHPRRPPV